jgi:hypothetical protein
MGGAGGGTIFLLQMLVNGGNKSIKITVYYNRGWPLRFTLMSARPFAKRCAALLPSTRPTALSHGKELSFASQQISCGPASFPLEISKGIFQNNHPGIVLSCRRK